MQTITEALAELKTIAKRIEKKEAFVRAYVGRSEMARDPLAADGGSIAVVARERQAITDLHERTVAIRRAIQNANGANAITVEGRTRSISDWLVWRREVAPKQKALLGVLSGTISNARNEARKRDGRIVEPGGQGKPEDIIINLSESELAHETEMLESILGALDGQLSLKNATITIEV